VALVNDEALVLRRYPWGESSLIVHLLTPRHGRVHLTARGVFRPTARYFAALDLFDTLEIEYSMGPHQELGNLRRAIITRRRPSVCTSLPAYRTGLAALELADIAARPGQSERPLFTLTEAALERLEGGQSSLAVSRVIFELEYLSALGLAPALSRCAACDGEAPAPPENPLRVPFSAGAGGRLCSPCAAEAQDAGRRVGTMPEDVLEAAATLAGMAPIRAQAEAQDPLPSGDATPHLPEELLSRVRDFLERFLDFHLETRPRSHEAFLASPNRNARKAAGGAPEPRPAQAGAAPANCRRKTPAP
jgi:DNA repair protein RecO (recombination protein O)